MTSKVTALQHEIRDDTMEGAAFRSLQLSAFYFVIVTVQELRSGMTYVAVLSGS